MEEREIILTVEGYNKLEEELKNLKGPKKMEVAERIKILEIYLKTLNMMMLKMNKLYLKQEFKKLKIC